jgi:hypothetical protein
MAGYESVKLGLQLLYIHCTRCWFTFGTEAVAETVPKLVLRITWVMQPGLSQECLLSLLCAYMRHVHTSEPECHHA